MQRAGYCCFSRKSPWQAPQDLPTALMSALTAASSPCLLPWTSLETACSKCSCACLNLALSLQIAGRAAVLTVVWSLVLSAKPSHGILLSAERYSAFRSTVCLLYGALPCAIAASGPKYLPCRVIAA